MLTKFLEIDAGRKKNNTQLDSGILGIEIVTNRFRISIDLPLVMILSCSIIKNFSVPVSVDGTNGTTFTLSQNFQNFPEITYYFNHTKQKFIYENL